MLALMLALMPRLQNKEKGWAWGGQTGLKQDPALTSPKRPTL